MRYFSTSFIIILFLFSAKNSLAKTDKYRCIWNMDPATMTTVAWNQTSGTGAVIYFDTQDYGNDWGAYANAQKADHNVVSKGMNNHFARLRNLIPGTTYYFVIKDSEGVSRRMYFRTAPDHPYERLSIVAGGDSRNNRKSRRNANLLVAKLRPHCVMFAGDMTGGDNDTQWPQWFDDWQLTISNDGRLTPIITARGNHEYSNETLVHLFDAPNKNVHFAFTVGGNLLRIYTLNSMIAAGGNQAAWLESDLQQHTDITWKFAHYHHPIRPHTGRKRDKDRQRTSWASLFYEYNVDLVMECDAHTVKTTWPIRPSSGPGNDEGFIRDDTGGTIYVGEGCWGAPLRPNDDDKAWTRNSGSFNQFKWIFVDFSGIEVRTVKTDNANDVGKVDPTYVFEAPQNLDVWNPSNGSVIYINKKDNTALQQPLIAIVPPSLSNESVYTSPTYTPLPTYTPPKSEPKPEPVVEPEPILEPKPIVKPEPTPTPVVKPEPKPEPVIEPEPKPEPVIKPEPKPEPVIKPEPKPVVKLKPEPIVKSEPKSEPELVRVAPSSIIKASPAPLPLPPPPPKPKPTPVVNINNLESFNTQVKDEVVHFMLNIKNESQQMFIELQRSTDGQYFSQIAVKPSAAPSKEGKDYKFMDAGALFLNSPKVYYRIKYGSNDSESRYSAVRSVQLTPWADYYELQLDPESNLLRIHYSLQEKSDVSLYIFNARGEGEIEQNFDGQQPGDYNRLVDLRGLTSGTYLLQLSSGDERVIRRIVIP